MTCGDYSAPQTVITGRQSSFNLPNGSFSTCTLTISHLEPGYQAPNPTIIIQTTNPPFGQLTPIPKEDQPEVARSFLIVGSFISN